jgi:hypothetical protein
VTYLHSGDLGDAIYALPSVAALGGGDILFASRPWTRTRWEDGDLLALIQKLFERQPYVDSVALYAGEHLDIDFSTFRNGGYKLGDTIIERQRRWVGAKLGREKDGGWLSNIRALTLAPIVINRALRWQGFHFPWKELVEEFGREMIFIGTSDECRLFIAEFGRVLFYRCADLYEAAQLIAGSELFIGSQSAPLAIANGLGKSVIVEACTYAPDCFLKRDNAIYSLNGELDFTFRGKRFVREGFQGGLKAVVGDRVFYDNDEVKLRVTARGAHAQDGTFALYEEVEVYG